ncbi:MAG: hypothetical protein ACE5O2_16030, partial [Armatimonadota bacterium]
MALAEADFSLDFEVTFEPGAGKGAARVAFCASDEKNRYELRLTNAHVSLDRIQKGRRTPLLSGIRIATRPTVPVDVTVTRRGDKVRIWVNDDLVGSVRDDTFGAGAIAYGVTSDKVDVARMQYAPLGAAEYESDPDEVVVYASGQAMITDRLRIPGGKTVRLVLPATADRKSIRIVDGGVPVKACRIVEDPLGAVEAGSGGVRAVSEGLKIEWDGDSSEGREAVVRYVASGMSWTPAYRLEIIDDQRAVLVMNVVVRNSAIEVRGAKISVVSGVVGGATGTLGSYTSMAAKARAALRALTGESLAADAHHVYPVPGRHDIPKDGAVAIEILAQELSYGTRFEWDVTRQDRVAAVYTLRNATQYPLAGGVVEVYRDEARIGRDEIGWTLPGGEMELSIVGASDIRASLDATVEQDETRGFRREYRHTYVYELQAPRAVQVELIVDKPRDAAEVQFTPQPTKQEGDECRWLVRLAPNEKATVTVRYYSDSSMVRR